MAESNNTRSTEEFDAFIKNLDINLAEFEKVGSTLLTLGYANFVYATHIDLLEINEINDTGQSPDSVTLLGQRLVLTGYIMLFIVSSKRLHEEMYKESVTGQTRCLDPYITLVRAYQLSVFSNTLRVQAFEEIERINNSGEVIE